MYVGFRVAEEFDHGNEEKVFEEGQEDAEGEVWASVYLHRGLLFSLDRSLWFAGHFLVILPSKHPSS